MKTMTPTKQHRFRRPLSAWVREAGLNWRARVNGSELAVRRAGGGGVLIEWVATVDGVEVGRDRDHFFGAMYIAEDHVR